jgi:nicotinamidase-related amidase
MSVLKISHRLTASGAALIVIDVQQKLLPAIADPIPLQTQIVRLVQAAQLLEIPIWATEQYPRGLGPTINELKPLIPSITTKTSFHACTCGEILENLHGRSIRHIALAGIEAHVCVLQTALELMRLGFVVQVAADAVGSRSRFDWAIALRRLEQAGVIISSVETIIFEWLESADHPRFKAISALVKNSPVPQPGDPESLLGL